MKSNPPVFQHPQLDGSSFFWKKGEIGILMLHGFTATTVEVKQIAAYFAAKGYSVAGPLLPGHGTTPEDMNTKTWRDWVETAESSYKALRESCREVFVLGESMGGLLALHLGVNHPDVTGLMIFAPALRIKRLWISEFLWPFKEYIYKANADDSMPWQGYNVVPLKAAVNLLRLQYIVKREFQHITTPALIFQGKLDTTIIPMGAVQVFEKIKSKSKRFIWLEESSHCILLDTQLSEVEAICLDFVENLLRN